MNQSFLSKLSIVILLVLFGLSLSACSEKEEPIDDTPIISVDDSTKGSELTIPESYPSELIPIYPNSHLFSIIASDQSFTIMLYSKDESDKVIEFYKNVFRNATNKMETVLTDAYTVFGELDGYTFTFDCGPDDELEGYKTLVLLGVVKNQK
jgi:hypothetical protein